MTADDYSSIGVGDTGAPFSATFQHADGTVTDLTGATISMKMQNSAGTVQTCTGLWNIASDPTTGKASYAYSAADVAVAGVWTLYIVITVAGKPQHGDTKTLVISSVP